jgi:hypothetical protein
MATRADQILNSVYSHLGIKDFSPEQKYKRINAIVGRLAFINSRRKINPKTTGTISERLCELALKARADGLYKNISDKWNWMADFSILGHPFNLLVSVKSFKAKERLLVSGSGNILSPTVGWGLFDDPGEWTEDRTRLYLFRSFIAIYLPRVLYKHTPVASRRINNINGRPFLRIINQFMDDLTASIDGNVMDITSF